MKMTANVQQVPVENVVQGNQIVWNNQVWNVDDNQPVNNLVRVLNLWNRDGDRMQIWPLNTVMVWVRRNPNG